MMKLFSTLLIVSVIVGLFTSEAAHIRVRRFAGGRNAEQGEIKYQVQLRLVKDELQKGYGEGYNCTGVLLSRELVLTTVGCVFDRDR